MTQELPAPLVPSEVDLRNFGFMPLDVLRLRDSDLAALATGDEFKAAVLLWCVAWHQVPAGSLPDDDRLLARYSGAGSNWKKVREEALRGFIKCLDGRLYHPTVCAKANEAWAVKAAQRARTEAATKAREQKRRGELEARDAQRDAQRDDLRDVERDVVQGRGEDRTGEDKEKDLLSQVPARPPAEPPQLQLVEGASKPKPYDPPDCPHQAVLSLWAEVLPAMPQHLPHQWRGTRADHLRARWRETAVLKGWTDQAEGLAYLRKFFAYVGSSPFLAGKVPPRAGQRPFVVELEWLVNPTNWAKTHEGKYHQESA